MDAGFYVLVDSGFMNSGHRLCNKALGAMKARMRAPPLQMYARHLRLLF